MHQVLRYMLKCLKMKKGLIWQPKFGDISADILGLAQYFPKPIFVLKPWAQVSSFEKQELMETKILKNKRKINLYFHFLF